MMENKINNSLRLICSLLVSLSVMMTLVIPAYAAKEYKISFKSGSKGVYQDGATSKDQMVMMNHDLPISPDTLAADLKIEPGYYFNGWNYTVKQTDITKSANYVAQYKRIIDEAVYRVSYVDNYGNELATQKVVTSNVGIVVAENAINIEGYAVDQLTKTATVEKKGTEITFMYVSTASGEIETITQHEVQVVVGTIPGQTGTGTTDNNTDNDIDITENNGNAAGNAAGGGTDDNGTEEIPDERTPLAGQNNQESNKGYEMLMGVGLIVIAILAGIVYIVKTKKLSDTK